MTSYLRSRVINGYENDGFSDVEGSSRQYRGGYNLTEVEKRSRSGYIRMIVTQLLIVLPEVAERMAFFSIMQGMPFFCLIVLGFSIDQTQQIVVAFLVATYATSMLWGFITDVFTGKYFTITISSFLYAVGLALVTGATMLGTLVATQAAAAAAVAAAAAAAAEEDSSTTEIVNATTVAPAIVNQTVAPVEVLNTTEASPASEGAPAIPQTGFEINLVHNMRVMYIFGLVICGFAAGGIKSSVAPLAGEQIEPLGKAYVRSFFNWYYFVINVGTLVATVYVFNFVYDLNYGYGYSLFIPLGFMGLTALVFMVGFNYYQGASTKGREWLSACGICRQGCRRGKPEANSKLPSGSEQTFLARAKIGLGGSFDHYLVDSIASVVKLLPFAMLIPIFWSAQGTVNTVFPQQVARMDATGVKPNVYASLYSFTFLIAIPVIDLVVCNIFQYIDRPLTPLRRISAGMIIGAFGMLCAALVETRRKSDGGWHMQVINMVPSNATVTSADLIIPQYALMGIAEVLVAAASLELAFTQAPSKMRGLATGIFQACIPNGVMFQGNIIQFLQQFGANWMGLEINDVELQNFYYLLAILLAMNAMNVIVFSLRYKYADPETFDKIEEIEMENATDGQS